MQSDSDAFFCTHTIRRKALALREPPTQLTTLGLKPLRRVFGNAHKVRVEELDELLIQEADLNSGVLDAAIEELKNTITGACTLDPACLRYSSKIDVRFHRCNFLKQPITVPARHSAAEYTCVRCRRQKSSSSSSRLYSPVLCRPRLHMTDSG